MFNPAFHTLSYNADITRDEHRYPTATTSATTIVTTRDYYGGRGYLDINTSGSYNLHLDPYMKHVYSEIPMSPMEAQQHEQQQKQQQQQQHNKPFEIHNLKDVEYITNQPETYNGNGTYSESDSNAYPPSVETTQCYPDLTAVNRKPTRIGGTPSGNAMTMDNRTDTYTVDRKYGCCSRQATIHVVVMCLAGIVYLGIGGITGYYLHKACESGFFFLSDQMIKPFYLVNWS